MGLFRDYMNEAGKSPVEVKWTKKNKNYHGEFFIGEQKFEIAVTLMDNDSADIYQFKFYRDESTKMYNDIKYAFGVVATIKVALDYIVRLLKPDILVFAASDNSTTRKALYRLEAANLATKYNYFDITRSKDIEEAGFASDVIFGIYKNKEILKNALSEF